MLVHKGQIQSPHCLDSVTASHGQASTREAVEGHNGDEEGAFLGGGGWGQIAEQIGPGEGDKR